MNLIQVIEQIGREKGIGREVLIDAVGAAILSASRKTLIFRAGSVIVFMEGFAGMVSLQ